MKPHFPAKSHPVWYWSLRKKLLCWDLSLARRGEEWEIENIAVAGRARRRGLGTRLLGEFLDLAQSRGAEAVFLEVRESNLAARRLYEKWAFVESGSTQGLLSRAGRGCDCLSAGACLRMHQGWCNQIGYSLRTHEIPGRKFRD